MEPTRRGAGEQWEGGGGGGGGGYRVDEPEEAMEGVHGERNIFICVDVCFARVRVDRGGSGVVHAHSSAGEGTYSQVNQ